MKHRGMKILSLLLTLALLVGVLPGMSAWASSPYGLSVGGVDVDQNNLSGEGWIFDPDTKTLTLSGATIAVAYGYGIAYGYPGTLNIVLSNNSTNTVSSSNDIGIFSYGNLSISGGGSLTVSGSDRGIRCYGTLEISGGSVDASSGSIAIQSYGTITISGGTVTAAAQSVGIASYDNITISGGTVTGESTGTNGAGIYASNNMSISGGSVTATGGQTAIYGTVKNSIAGTGWTDTAGTQDETSIPISETARQLNYKKMVFEKPAGYTVSFDAKWRMDGTSNEFAPGAKINIGHNTTFVAVWQAASSGGAGFGFGGGDDGWSGYVTGLRAYRVSLAPMQGGSAALVLNTGESGESMNVYPQTTVRVVPSPAPGYKLASIVWSLIDGSASYDITQAQNLVMPAMDVVVHVTFAPVG